MEILMRIFLLLLFFVFGVRFGAPAASAAQDAEHPLLTLFAYVPPSAAVERGALLSYIDYDVILSSNDAPALTSDMSEDERAAVMEDPRWFANLFRIRVGVQEIGMGFVLPEDEFTLAFGFAAWNIDRALTFGQPPSDASIIMGAFDPDAVRAAFAARDYVEAEIGGVPALCWSEGCDQGMTMNLENRLDRLPFGGQLGMRPPFALPAEGVIAMSRDLDRLTAMMDARAGARRSLREDRQWGALAETLIDPRWGALGQAVFVTPLDVVANMGMMPQEFADQVAALGDLPIFEVAALADYDNGAEQVHVIAAAYPDADAADSAAIELAARLKAFDPGNYAELGVTVDEPLIVPLESGGAVVALALRYPYSEEVTDPDGQPIATGRIYAYWLSAFYRMEFLPLLLSE
jgi:hypothetical protein